MPVNEECTITCPACGHDGSLDEWTINAGRYTCGQCVRSFRRFVGPGKRVEFIADLPFYLPGKVTIELEAPTE
jgi:hypothetical protein